LVVTSDLLNPGEDVGVALTVADSKSREVDVIARAEYLKVRRLELGPSAAEIAGTVLSNFAPGHGMLSQLINLYRGYRSSRRP
jgi:hypothetical protein